MVEADLRGWLALVGVVLGEDQIDGILQEAETVLASYKTPAGSVSFRLSAHLLAAKKP